jgi:hypothetical protein
MDSCCVTATAIPAVLILVQAQDIAPSIKQGTQGQHSHTHSQKLPRSALNADEHSNSQNGELLHHSHCNSCSAGTCSSPRYSPVIMNKARRANTATLTRRSYLARHSTPMNIQAGLATAATPTCGSRCLHRQHRSAFEHAEPSTTSGITAPLLGITRGTAPSFAHAKTCWHIQPHTPFAGLYPGTQCP